MQDSRAPPCRPEKETDGASDLYHLDLSDWDDFIDSDVDED